MAYFTTTVPATATSSAREIAEAAVDQAKARGMVPVDAHYAEDRVHPDVAVEGYITFPGRRGAHARVGIRVA